MNAQMRVAYLINQYPKVSHSFIRREIRALERLGVAVMRISIRGWNEQLVDEDDLEERRRTRYVLRDGALALLLATLQTCMLRPVHLFRALVLELKMARRSDRPLLVHLVYLVEACRIFEWLKRENVTHLHAHFGTNSAEVAMLVGVLGGPPWSFTAHGPEEFDKAPALGLAEKIRQAAFVVAISSFGRGQLYRLVDHSYWPKIHVVRCGLDCKFLDAVSDQPPPSPRRLVCVGRICAQKGQLLLLEAARKLADQGVEFELVLAGDGEMRSVAEVFIDRHKLRSNVRITGWISNGQVRQEILAARALVLPSFAEGLPVVLMEAMALNRPVISTFVAGIPELVGRENGWLVASGDVDALVGAIMNCMRLPAERIKQLGSAGRNQAALLHNIDAQVSTLIDLFKEAAGLPQTSSVPYKLHREMVD
jgi:glycosyltransferase involved in cell wall biosynthesis